MIMSYIEPIVDPEGDYKMSSSIEALKEAVELEKAALDKVRTALASAKHDQTKSVLENYVTDKEQKIDTLSWMVMAESGDFKPEEGAASEAAESGEAKPAGKCPFTGQLAAMGIDISQMGDTMGKKPHE